MKWVSVNKKLPEWYEWVFVYSEGVIKQTIDKSGMLKSRRIENGKGGWYQDLNDTTITHWSLYPDPPNSKNITKIQIVEFI